jgi:3-methyladenine DNA glycosylase AlkD
MDMQGVMKQLKAWEHPKMRAVNAKHGAGENQFGVNLGKLRGLAAKVKRDHTLALELWKSGNIDAMNLATLIMDPKQLSQSEVEKLAKDLSYYTTTDWFVKNVVKARPFKGELCRKWAASKDEYVGRAGWTLMAGQLEEHDREELLDTIEKRMKAAPFRTQEPMNYCLVKIAVDYPQLRKRAIAIGHKLEVLKDYPVPKGCTSPFAPTWIAYILEHRR